ncbi:MAG TPA: TonB-dependent receptor [Porphyromonadaceae bacterium]|nr:TonB-dependent receptor [Porphyromonadaceae bacterium]
MRFLVAFIMMTTACLFSNMQAQNQVSLSGRILDDAQKPIPFVLIAVDGSSISTYSDDKGYYQLNIPAGKYTFTISAFEYETQNTTLDVKDSTKHDFIISKRAIHLSTVKVYGKSKTAQLRESSFSVNAIEVKSYISSLNNLNDLIGRSSGIKIREDGGVGGDFDLSINGLSGNSIRYFIDGVPLSSVGNAVSLANLPINLVDRVEIYKGVVPADLGADALGGAVNIITKKNVNNYLDASYGIGSFHTHKADLNAQYTDKKTGIFIRPTFGLNYAKNDYTMKGVQVPTDDRGKFIIVDAKRFHDDYYSLLGQLNMGIANKRWTDLLSFTTSYSYVETELQTGPIQDKVYGRAKRNNRSFGISAQYQKNDFLVKRLASIISVSHTWDYSIVTDTTFRKYDWRGRYIPAKGNEITGRDRSIRHIDRPLTIARANFNYILNENHAFNMNYMMNHIANKRTDDFDPEFVPSQDLFSKHIIGLSYKQSFWQDKWNNHFFIKNYISHLTIGQQDLSWITGSNKMPKSSTSDNWGYGFSTRFRFAEWLAVKGSAEQSVRLPLAREYMGNGSTIYPNFLLKPENSRNYNLGLFGNSTLAPQHKLFYEAGLFYRNVEDYIRLVITEAEGTSQYQNVKNVTVKGIEGEIRYEYNDCVQAIANISYLDEKSKTKYLSDGKPDVTYNNQIPNKPWLYSNMGLIFTQKNIAGQKDTQLKASYFFQYVHWFYLTWKGYGTAESKSIIPSQYVHNASLTYSFKNERYNISLECNNIFDRLLYDNYRMQKPGRSFFCKVRVFIN